MIYWSISAVFREWWMILTFIKTSCKNIAFPCSCNKCTCNLSDMYALRPMAFGLQVHVTGKSLVPMLQSLHGEHQTLQYSITTKSD